jgi:tight adherence protein B
MSELFANLDQETLILIGGGIGAVVLILVLAVATILLMRPRARLRNRMAGLGLARGATQTGRASGGGARQRRVQERLKELEDKGKKRTRGHEMRVQIMQAGLDVHPRSFILISIAVGLMAAVIYLLSGYPQLGAIGVAIVAGIMLPRKVLRFLAGRRQKKFTQNFANAIDVLVRGIRSGLPVGECLAIIGRESPEPIGEEFRLMVEGQRLGMTMEELFRRGLERIPTPEYKFFSIVLQIQQQTGGNLAETLENLSRVLRERKKLRDKVKALSAEAKASAMIIGALPLFVMLAVRVMTPDYLDPLFEEEQGQKMLAGAVIWMLLGVGMMAKMINFQI